MTLGECLQRADALRPNAGSEDEKDRWVLELEGELERDFFARYEGWQAPEKGPGRASTLLASGPFEELYVFRVLARLELADREWDSYNVYNALANQLLSEFKKAWHRTHAPKAAGR